MSAEKRASLGRRAGLRRIRSTGIYLAKGGIRYSLIDAFHRRHDFTGVAIRLWLACVFVGIGAALVAIVVDVAARATYQLRVTACVSTDSFGTRMAIWVASAAVAVFGATLMIKAVPAAAGSGLPEVKVSLAGIMLFDALSIRCLLVKPLALALAIASSLSIGKEGPFVHCACCVAYQLANSPLINFNKLVREQRQLELLVAACAAGVVFTFGAPVGGVLFAAEITSTGLYSLDHLPRAFFCVTLSLALYHVLLGPMLRQLIGSDPLAMFTTSFSPRPFTLVELLAFALQGAAAAVIAAVLQLTIKQVARLRPLLQNELLSYTVPALVAALCSAFNLALSSGDCLGGYTEGGGATLDILFNAPSVDAPPSARGASAAERAALDDALPSSSLLTLLTFGLFKLLVLSPLSFALPVPTGVFLPTFVSGAALGSLYGSCLRRLAPALFLGSLPGYFAVTGAAALACASTHTMSTAVVTLELTGQLFLQIPLLVATTTAYSVARLLGTPSIFDAFVTIKGLPGATAKGVPLASDGPLAHSSRTLHSLREHVTPVCVPRFIPQHALTQLLTTQSTRWDFDGVSLIPIIRSEEDPALLGVIPIHTLNALADYPMPLSAADYIYRMRSSTASSVGSAARSAAASMDSGSEPATPEAGGSSQSPSPLRKCSCSGAAPPSTPPEDGAAPSAASSTSEPLLEPEAARPVEAEVVDSVLDVLCDADGAPREGVDRAPLTVSVHTKLARISYLVRHLSASTLCVVEDGALIGVVTRINLFRVEAAIEEEDVGHHELRPAADEVGHGETTYQTKSRLDV